MAKCMLKSAAFLLGVFLCLTACSGTGPAAPAASSSAAAPVPSAAASSDQTVKSVYIGTGPTGGTAEIVGAATIEILKKAIPGIEFSSAPSTGTNVNIPLIESGEADIGLVDATAISAALAGTSPYNQKYENFYGLMSLYNFSAQLWLNKGIGVEKFSDLKSKKVCFGVPGSPPYEMYTELASLAGFDEAASNAAGGKFVPLAWSEATAQLQDGNIDALFWFTSYPHPAIESISMGHSYDLMQIEKELLDGFKKTRNAFIDVTLPAGTYTWQENDVETIGASVCYVIRKDMPDDVVYNITKALYENMETFRMTHSGMKGMSADNIGKGMVVQIHPGAAKFYDEVGVPYDKP